ncbi:C40 family peptidase [Cryobacterium tepidiphilum]|uniref:NlpC/P60 family protein n=1 Tax=Cryobacterium tepidiphilum TaxID=2486026 RepID=A0A3M8LMC2_9MICO|nr:C40 family peptidase [Cryobacterium tepidiphilum]RNE66677.1 NlpC/P60 family protein [Cryobacterium tepidiphilum]
MTMIEAMGRIQQIQSTLQQLRGVQAPASTGATAATAGSAGFATSLAGALGAAAATSTGTATAPANPGAATGSDVVAAAEKYLGVPYVFGGEDASGMDCSGLVQRVYGDLGIDMPRLVSGQMTVGTEVGSLAEAKPGDLIVTGGGDHILIYAGDHKVIHAPYEGRTVCLVDAYMDDSDIDTIRRVIPDSPAPTAASAVAALAGTAGLGGTALSGTGLGGPGAGLGAGGSDMLSAALASIVKGSAS